MLLMLLEISVWDPLAEWTRGAFHDDAAIGSDAHVALDLSSWPGGCTHPKNETR